MGSARWSRDRWWGLERPIVSQDLWPPPNLPYPNRGFTQAEVFPEFIKPVLVSAQH